MKCKESSSCVCQSRGMKCNIYLQAGAHSKQAWAEARHEQRVRTIWNWNRIKCCLHSISVKSLFECAMHRYLTSQVYLKNVSFLSLHRRHRQIYWQQNLLTIVNNQSHCSSSLTAETIKTIKRHTSSTSESVCLSVNSGSYTKLLDWLQHCYKLWNDP